MGHGSDKTKEQLATELAALRQKVAELEVALSSAETRSRSRMYDNRQGTENTLRIALEAAKMVAWDLDLATDIVQLSSSVQNEIEFAGARITTGAQIIDLIHPEDRDRVLEVLQNNLLTGDSYCTEFRSIGVDGRVLWMSSHGKILLDADRNPIRVTGVVMDITERKEQELQLIERQRCIDSIVAIMPGIVYLYNLQEQRSVVLSPQHRDLFGYTREEVQELAKIGRFHKIHPEDRLRIAKGLQKMENVNDGQVMGLEYRIQHKNGTWNWVLSRNTVFSRTADGKVHQILGVAVDINARKQAEEALQAFSRQLLKAQEKERQYLAYELHEEIGQSLTALLMKMQMLESELTQSHSRPPLQDGISLVQTMISQVRNLSLELRPTMLDSLGLVAALQWYLQQQSQRSGIAMDVFTDGAVIRSDRAIEETCFRVIQEAITNAVQYANAQNIWVELRYKGNAIELSVRDDGDGFILADIQQKPQEAWSIGLVSMEERLRQIGGHLVIQSTLGEGTEVQITVPLYDQKSHYI